MVLNSSYLLVLGLYFHSEVMGFCKSTFDVDLDFCHGFPEFMLYLSEESVCADT